MQSRDFWAAVALLLGMLMAGAIGYLIGRGERMAPPVAVAAPAQVPPQAAPSTLWRGLTVRAEDRCASYDADEYPYSPAVETQVVAQQGGSIYGPYTGTWFGSTAETDIEHIVARSEAHDSGLCAAGAEQRRAFAGDPLNLTLAGPVLNRNQKGAKDAAEWLPARNQCWFADRVVQVRLKYGLTVDRAEAAALDRVLAGCTSTAMMVTDPPSAATPASVAPVPARTVTPPPVATVPAPIQATPASGNALDLYDDNKNGRITCAEARKHGIAPVHRGDPAYEYMQDGDGDGVVCE